MTTIVADAELGFIAADRQATTNDIDRPVLCRKIKRLDICGETHLVASAGNEGPAIIFEEWYEFGSWDEPLDPMESLESGEDFTTVILSPEGIFVADKFMRPYRINDRFYAAGSGGSAVLAVLLAGCSIDKAMEVAQKMDAYSGFGFDIEYLEGRG